MTDDLLLEPSRGEGPVGTGVHVLHRTQAPSGTTIADVWLTVLSSAAAIVGTLGWLDETRERVPLGTAVRALGRPAKSPRQGA